MDINTSQIVTMTEANQNFSKVVKIADRNGCAVVFKNNVPRYMVVNIEDNPIFLLTEEEKINIAAMRMLAKYSAAFKELSK